MVIEITGAERDAYKCQVMRWAAMFGQFFRKNIPLFKNEKALIIEVSVYIAIKAVFFASKTIIFLL